MAYYFIADLHFGHKNALAFDNREFEDIEQHDQTLIKRWNEVIGPDDEVFLLGDVSWYNATKTIGIINQLNGLKHLIVGNHDKRLLRNKDFRDLFVEIADYKEIELPDGKGIVLSHYPIPCFNNHYFGWYHLYGHVHNSFEANMMNHVKFQMMALYQKPCNMYNVGAMIGYVNHPTQAMVWVGPVRQGLSEKSVHC